MSLDYINEAFKALSFLNEETFDASLDGINNLSDFMDQDNVEDVVKVIDPEAEVPEELQDSYIGKVITNCNVCHSHIFENKDDIVVDEDGVVNPEKQCPYCGETSGFVIVGEIVEFTQSSENNDNPEAKEDNEEAPVEEETPVEDTSLEEGLLTSAGSMLGNAVSKVGNGIATIGKGISQFSEETEEENVDEGLGGALVGGALGGAAGGPVGALAGAVGGSFVQNNLKEEENEVNESSLVLDRPKDLTEIEGTIANVLKKHSAEINQAGSDEVRVKSIISDVLRSDECKSPEQAEEAISIINRCTGSRLWSTIGTYMSGLKVANIGRYAKRRLTASLETDDVEEGLGGALVGGALGGAAGGPVGALAGAVGGSFVQNKLAESYYGAKYTDIHNIQHKILFRCDGDIEDAENLLDGVIPEPYVKAILLGSMPLEGAQRDGFELLENKEYNLPEKVDNIDNEADETTPEEYLNGIYEGEMYVDLEKVTLDIINAPYSFTIEEVIAAAPRAGFSLKNIGKETPYYVLVHNNANIDEITKNAFNSLTEDVNNINVETDDSVINVHTEEDGKVVVSTEPKAEEGTSDEMIAPLSDETMSDIESNNDIVSEVPQEDKLDAETEVNLDIDDVDEDSLDELGESYLKSVYENVDSFKTTAVTTTNSTMIVEGIITFSSGAKKRTGFMFEALTATPSGRVKFSGKNEHFSRGNKTFTLCGTVAQNKLIAESLAYNYKAKSTDGKSTHVYGTVTRK